MCEKKQRDSAGVRTNFKQKMEKYSQIDDEQDTSFDYACVVCVWEIKR